MVSAGDSRKRGAMGSARHDERTQDVVRWIEETVAVATNGVEQIENDVKREHRKAADALIDLVESCARAAATGMTSNEIPGAQLCAYQDLLSVYATFSALEDAKVALVGSLSAVANGYDQEASMLEQHLQHIGIDVNPGDRGNAGGASNSDTAGGEIADLLDVVDAYVNIVMDSGLRDGLDVVERAACGQPCRLTEATLAAARECVEQRGSNDIYQRRIHDAEAKAQQIKSCEVVLRELLGSDIPDALLTTGTAQATPCSTSDDDQDLTAKRRAVSEFVASLVKEDVAHTIAVSGPKREKRDAFQEEQRKKITALKASAHQLEQATATLRTKLQHAGMDASLMYNHLHQLASQCTLTG